MPYAERSFLNRLKLSRAQCEGANGICYPGDAATVCVDGAADCCGDCVIDFGYLSECPSWEVHGMGHTRDPPGSPVHTYIPFAVKILA